MTCPGIDTPPNHLLTLQEGEERLQPYTALLNECIQDAWSAWERDYQSKHHVLGPRSRAAIVYDEIVFRAAQKFTGVSGAILRRRNSSFLLYIGNDILIRFKKIKKNGKCSCIQTHQQALFAVQQIPLPGMEGGTLLHVGYALDDAQIRIVRKSVVLQFANEVLWTIELPVEADSGAIRTMPMPVPTAPKPRWTAKTMAEQQDKKKRKGA